MKKRLLIAGSLLALVGCSGGGAPAPSQGGTVASPQPQATTPVSSSASAASCAQKAFYSPLPDAAIHFDFPFRVARDRVYASDGGKLRRGLSLEYTQGEAGAIWDAIMGSMQAAGYVPVAAPASGEYKATFAKSGRPGIYIAVTPDPGSNPTGADVKGSIWMSWSSK